MQSIIAFLMGPALWVSFALFFGGLAARLIFLYRLSRRKDEVVYQHIDLKWALRSILHWLIPWASRAMRRHPFYTATAFAFHICLLTVPLFLNAHNVLWAERFDVSLWSMPDSWAEGLSVMVLVTALLLWLRRRRRPEVRILTGMWDYALLALAAAPFLTGLLAYHQWGPYQPVMVLHILAGEVLLILIPFTKLGHMVLFFFTRAFIGFEMGARRGARPW